MASRISTSRWHQPATSSSWVTTTSVDPAIAVVLSNPQISAQLYLSGSAVSKHVSNVFAKLGLPAGEDNRRVRAVLAYLTAATD